MDEDLKQEITGFFNYWRKRHAFISDLDFKEYHHEANVLLWAAIDALSNLWAENIGKEQCKKKKGKRMIFDAFLARYGGEVFQIVSLPDVWNRADREINQPKRELNENTYKFLSTIGECRNPTGTDEYIIRQISNDLTMDKIVSATLLKYPDTDRDQLKEWLTLSRYGAIAYKEMRSAYIHEGRSGNNAHGFKSSQSANQPTYLSGIYTTPPSIGFALEFMLPVLKCCIDAFEAEALMLKKDPVPPTPHRRLINWLKVYQNSTPQVQMGIEPTVRLNIDNEPQPDGFLFISSESGGNSTLSEDGFLEGAPELVVEIATSSTAINLRDKKRAYRRRGVQEYIVWQVFGKKKIDWFSLDDGDYISLRSDERGVICSVVFPGLWLDVAAMLQGNMQQVLTVLQTGINSGQHQDFVKKLMASE